MSKLGLTATPTVDKNGKHTTVYRKTASTKPGKKLPVPTLKDAKQGAEKVSTPLPVPTPVSDGEYERFKRNSRSVLSLRFGSPSRDEVALISRMVLESNVPEEVVLKVSDYMGMMSIGERVSHYDYNAFLIAERFVRDGDADIILKTPSLFMDAIEGLARKRRESDSHTVPLIETEEELASHVAVVKMLAIAGDTEPLENPSFKRSEYHTAEGTRHNGSYFKNWAFTSLLRERPEDFEQIKQYVTTRGVPKDKTGVQALLEYLDSDEHVPAMEEGWL